MSVTPGRTELRRARPIVIHYHLFKNGGTSLDHTLRASFGATWQTYDASDPGGSIEPASISEYLSANPWVCCLSSHTALLPPPQLTGTEILPILFLRNPLDRARSVYTFERTQKEDTPGSVAARGLNLAEYVEWRLDEAKQRADRTIANFQTSRLHMGGQGSKELDRALDVLDRLPFVGLVEQYPESIRRLQIFLVKYFPRLSLSVHRLNVTSTADGLDERLTQLRRDLGGHLYQRLEDANADDLVLWTHARSDYELAMSS